MLGINFVDKYKLCLCRNLVGKAWKFLQCCLKSIQSGMTNNYRTVLKGTCYVFKNFEKILKILWCCNKFNCILYIIFYMNIAFDADMT